VAAGVEGDGGDGEHGVPAAEVDERINQ